MTRNPLQRYQVVSQLGSGRQAHTYRGVDRDTNRDVAIKVLSLRDVDKWKAFDLFEREAAVLKTLDHPGIPRYIDNYASESTGDYFLVMELVDGVPLSDYVSGSRRLKASSLRDVFEQALDILEYLHSLAPPVIHRDIKPSNLMLARDGHLSLVDFGGVRHQARPEGGSTMIGTFGYMAPEQLHGEATAATDLYALGATIVALTVGQEAENLPHDGLRIDLDSMEIPASVVPVLAGMLQPEPSQRLGTVADVRRVLAQGTPRPPPKAESASRNESGTSKAGRPPTALVRNVPSAAKALARVPAPLSVIVWVFTAAASGLLLVTEVLLLPLIYQLISMAQVTRSDRRKQQLERTFSDARTDVRQTRETLNYIASRTKPVPPDSPSQPRR